jgi:hypothetical protein
MLVSPEPLACSTMHKSAVAYSRPAASGRWGGCHIVNVPRRMGDARRRAAWPLLTTGDRHLPNMTTIQWMVRNSTSPVAVPYRPRPLMNGCFRLYVLVHVWYVFFGRSSERER